MLILCVELLILPRVISIYMCQLRQIIGGAKGYSAPPPQNYLGEGAGHPPVPTPMSNRYILYVGVIRMSKHFLVVFNFSVRKFI